MSNSNKLLNTQRAVYFAATEDEALRRIAKERSEATGKSVSINDVIREAVAKTYGIEHIYDAVQMQKEKNHKKRARHAQSVRWVKAG